MICHIFLYKYYSQMEYNLFQPQEQQIKHFKVNDKKLLQLSIIASSISQRLKSFCDKIINIYNNQIEQEQLLFSWSYNFQSSSESPICCKVLGNGSTVYRCYDCWESPSSVLCQECFVGGNHFGHNYLEYQSTNGCCDCGNDEVWNPKGFCDRHGKNTKRQEQKSNHQIKEIFIRQMKFAWYIYFMTFVDQNSKGLEKAGYGQQFMDYLLKINSSNYDTKLATWSLLQEKFGSQYPQLPKRLFQLNILELVFHQYKVNESLNIFVHLSFELFPIQEFREAIIINYFLKISRPEEGLGIEHPLASLNFQFLTCIKKITSLIEKNKIKPLSFIHNFQKNYNIMCLYKKLYEDLDYMNYLKAGQAYHKLHFQLIDISTMAGYRNLYNIQGQNEINLDEFFLKVFGCMVKNIKKQSKLLAKGIKDLLVYLSINSSRKSSSSLAHQRAVALLILAYCQGNLERLKQIEFSNNLIKQIGFELKQFLGLLENLLKNGFYMSVNYNLNRTDYMKIGYQHYFLSVHPQKQFCEDLSFIYNKIILILGDHYFTDISYYDIGLNLLLIQDTSMKENKLKIYRIIEMMGQIVKCFFMDIDQLSIANFIGIDKNKEICIFYSQLLANFSNISFKQFKNIAIACVNSIDAFELFCQEYIQIVKGQIKSKIKSKPLSTFIYEDRIRELTNSQFGTVFTLTKYEQTSLLSNKNIISEATFCKIIQLLQQSSISQSLKDKAITKLSLIYQITKSQEVKRYLKLILQNIEKYNISQPLKRQLNQILRHNIQLTEDSLSISEDQETLTRREKLKKKRGEKQTLIRQNQAKMLLSKQFINQEQQQLSALEQKQLLICTICKASTIEPLMLTSTIDFTNLYEKNVLKNNRRHLIFMTCGHPVHGSCYQKSNGMNQFGFCFLCKRQCNLLFPIYSKSKSSLSSEQIKSLLQQFQISLINSRLISEQEDIDFSNFNENESMSLLLINSLTYELLFSALHNPQFFKRYQYILYKEIIFIIQQFGSQVIKSALHNNIDIITNENQIQANIEALCLYVKYCLLDFLPIKFDFELPKMLLPKLKVQQMHKVKRIISDIIDNKQKDMKQCSLNIINQNDIFWKAPNDLSGLILMMGKCEHCTKTTNFIYICLLCGWKACRKCYSLMKIHSKENHLNGTIFIDASSGAIKYLSRLGIYQADILYENFMGESISSQEIKNVQNYHLNKDKLTRLHTQIIQYQIDGLILKMNKGSY